MKWFASTLLVFSLSVISSTSYAEVISVSDSDKSADHGNKIEDIKKTIRIPGIPNNIWTFGLEEDGILGYGSDNNYTMGVSIAHLFREAPDESSLASLPWSVADFIDNKIPCKLKQDWCDKGATQFYWWHLGGSGFSPNNVKTSAPIYDDRPFAALFFWSAGYMRNNNGVFSDRKKVELHVGLLGTPVGYWLQSGIHSIFAPDDMPQGWPHQIGNGFSPTFLFQENWIKDLKMGENLQNFGMNFSYGYAVGYWVKANSGVSFQYGPTQADRDAQVGTLPQLPQTFAIADNPNSTAPIIREKPVGFSIWLNGDFNAFAYNEMLRGAWFGQNDVTLSPSQINPYVFQGTVGVDLSFIPKYIFCMNPEKYRLFATYNIRNNEITTSHGANHSWGGIFFSHYY